MIRSSTTYLSVEERGRKVSDVRLGAKSVRIGRRPDNDVVLVSPGVAPYHARVEPLGTGHRIVDLGATSGILFHGERVKSHVFTDGDVIRIGDPVTGNFISLVYQDVGKRSQSQQAAPVRRCTLEKPVVRIGREDCDLTLPSLQVSREHAEVRRNGAVHEIVDLGSTNGTFVAGHRVETTVLRVGDIIQVGPFKLTYTGRSLDQFDQAGALRVDARELTRVTNTGKVLVDHVSLVIEPREFVAIVGASGAGKTTLMSALAGYQFADHGALRVNGDDFYANYQSYRGILGYVPQDDILHATLTVEEALGYTARLRMSADTTPAEISARIDRVLADVEMSAHRKQRIVDLSGGQRKRVSIASELLADPSLFFLDEPTSGLDPGLEKKMMYTLRYLADAGRTVVLVTHATANIMQCDQVVFMADGKMVYYGPPAGALRMFGVTSGDFADIYTKLQGRSGEAEAEGHSELSYEYAFVMGSDPNRTAPPTMAELWELRYQSSDEYKTYVYERQRARKGGDKLEASGVGLRAVAPGLHKLQAVMTIPPSAGERAELGPPVPPPVPVVRQFRILAERYVRLIASDRKNLAILLLQAPIIGAVILLAARANALQTPTSTNGRLVLFLLAVVGVWFGVLNSVREVTKEAKIYRRERLANLRIGTYLLSKLAVMAGLCLVQSVVLLGVLALRVDFSPEFTALTPDGFVDLVRGPPLGLWGASLVTVFLTSLSGVGLGLLISTVVSSSDKAMSVVPLALIPQLVFAMALMPLPAALASLSYLTGARWGMEALGSITHLLEPRDMTTCLVPGDPFSCEVYATVNYDPSAWHVLAVWGVLALYTTTCVALTAWSLRRSDRRVQ